MKKRREPVNKSCLGYLGRSLGSLERPRGHEDHPKTWKKGSEGCAAHHFPGIILILVAIWAPRGSAGMSKSNISCEIMEKIRKNEAFELGWHFPCDFNPILLQKYIPEFWKISKIIQSAASGEPATALDLWPVIQKSPKLTAFWRKKARGSRPRFSKKKPSSQDCSWKTLGKIQSKYRWNGGPERTKNQ